MRPAPPAALHALAQALRKFRMGVPLWAPRRCGKRSGMMRPSFFSSASTRATWAARSDFSTGGRYTNAPLVILRRAGVQAQRAVLELEVPALECEHLRLHPPAVGAGEVEGRLEIGVEMPAYGVVLLALEEALARPGFLQLGEQRAAELDAQSLGHLAEIASAPGRGQGRKSGQLAHVPAKDPRLIGSRVCDVHRHFVPRESTGLAAACPDRTHVGRREQATSRTKGEKFRHRRDLALRGKV